jgi:PAS domain S-box-containing protein
MKQYTVSHKPQILVVGDANGQLSAMTKRLSGEFAIRAASSGEKALELAAGIPVPELILLDIELSGMGGREVLRRLKADPATVEIPVILVAALTEPAGESHELEAVDYITKPVNPDLLKVRIRAQLELRNSLKLSPLSTAADNRIENRKFTVLVVDDTLENLHELVSALSDEYFVTVADNGQKAVELVSGTHPPDLILLDIRMPGMDGYETCRQIKKSETGQRIPVIFISVLDESDAKIKGFSLGGADYVTKPFDIDELRARLRTHIHLGQLRFHFEQQLAQRTASLLTMTNRLQAMLNAIPDTLLELDLQGRYLTIPAIHYKLSDSPNEELVGKSVVDVLPADAAKVHLAALQEADRTGLSQGREFQLEQPQGKCWFELTVSRLDDPVATDTRFLVLSRDISERKRAVEVQLRSVRQFKEAMIATAEAISRTVEMRDPYTAGHQRRVADLSNAIGEALGLTNDRLEGLRFGANLHDIGKIQLPAEILSSPRILTPLEHEFIKTHPSVGGDIVTNVEFPWPIREMILQHHERLDGSGYPQGLTGQDIILEARILAVADVVEAMSSHRPYRPSLGIDAALHEIESGRGTKYDPVVVDVCLKLFRVQGYTIP